MPPLTLSQLLFIARQHYDAGRLVEADGLCNRILGTDRASAPALHLAGLVALRSGRHEAAVGFLQRAVNSAPDSAAFHADLGHGLRKAGQVDEAIAAFRRCVDLAPDSFDGLCGLAESLIDRGQTDNAIETYHRALVCRPDVADARGLDDPAFHLKLGRALQETNRLDEAMAAFRAALAINGDDHDAHRGLGEVQREMGQLLEAVASFQRAIELQPLDAEAYARLGNVLLYLGFLDRAAEAYYQAVALKPGDDALYSQIGQGVQDDRQVDLAGTLAAALTARRADNVQVCFNAAKAFQRRRHVDAAMVLYRRVLELEENSAAALNNLSLALKDAGRLDEAIACCRQAVSTHPDVSACHGNLLYLLHFHSDSNGASLHTEHAKWAARHAAPLKEQIRPHDNDRSADHRLRIGYVSPNFNVHPVGRFLSALFRCHDHERFEIVCYSSTRRPDAMTERFREQADQWVETALVSDAALAERIRADRIDILVDLTMHMADSRLLAFARKPAPVQISYLAYCSMTGLEAINYRLTDPYLDPKVAGATFPCPKETMGRMPMPRCEQPIPLPQSYWCYDPVIEAPRVNPLPALSNGHITFASLNNFCKVSPSTRAMWARLLRATPGSRLVIHAHRGAHRAALLQQFAAEGIDPHRLEFFDLLTLPDYFALHHRVDVALDPFPYPGGTTTCDALWMGVPTVSLVGEAAHTRSGLSILSNTGLPELAVESPEQYLQAAIALAADLPRLSQLRGTLRERMRNSPLMDGERFARDMEGVYRSVWRDWREGH